MVMAPSYPADVSITALDSKCGELPPQGASILLLSVPGERRQPYGPFGLGHFDYTERGEVFAGHRVSFSQII